MAIASIDRKSVKKVIERLRKERHPEAVIELYSTARSALDAAGALGVPVGAIVKTLVFVIDSSPKEIPVVTLIAGDRRCNTEALTSIFNVDGRVRRPDADLVKEITGFSIGGVSPVALPEGLPLVIDSSLRRFKTIWSSAGHSHCVFGATFEQLQALTNAPESNQISEEP